MKNVLKKISLLFTIAFSIFLIQPNTTYAQNRGSILPYQTTPSQKSQYDGYDYVLNSYNVDIKVNENNTFDITETITAYFNVPKHGIYRTIPLRNTITKLDGTTSKNRAKITNLNVNNEYSTSRVNGKYQIKIGSANKTLTGEQKYIISYNYNIGKDPSKEYDEFYYNIIGNEWDTAIGNVSFSITMPKDFDESKLGFSSGAVGSTNSAFVDYVVDGNTITGQYNSILNQGEALTIRLELEEGYFVGAGFNTSPIYYLLYLLPIVFLLIALFWWHKYGRDDQVIETIEFYPPEGFNSLEVGFLYKGKADSDDVVSLLIYLANQGYLKISETDEKVMFTKKKGFKITKLKEYDGDNINEKTFFDGLFNSKSEVTASDLYDKFYKTTNEIISNINNKENKNKIFEKIGSSKFVFIILMMIATYGIITIRPLLEYSDAEMLMVAILFQLIGFSALYIMVFGKTNKVTKIFGFIWSICFGVAPWLATTLPALLDNIIYLIGYFIGLVCLIGLICIFKILPKRTPYGNEMLGKIRGFKTFLETAEKDKLESMVMNNPTYFYDVLPYTYVLGVSDKWINKFESINLQSPDWYDSPNRFNTTAFRSFMNTTMKSVNSTMSSSSSGGGSSGGGSGGGGGGSW